MVLIFTGSLEAGRGSAAVPREEQPNPTLECAAVNVSRFWRLSLHPKKKSRWLVFLCFFLSICYIVSVSRLVVLMRAVCQTVPSQVTVAPKHLSAAATAVGLDVCMGEKVSFQVTSLIKGSSACGAFVGRLLFRFKASKGLFLLILLECVFNFQSTKWIHHCVITTQSFSQFFFIFNLH